MAVKPIIVVNDRLLNALSWSFPIAGILLFPWIILRKEIKQHERYEVLIRHETIHFKQAQELFVVGFYVCYVLNWCVNIIRYKSLDIAYSHILFEKEAYANEHDDSYLDRRKLFSFMAYIGKSSKAPISKPKSKSLVSK